MRLQGMIYDFDGTLADTIALSCEALAGALERNLGVRYTIPELVAHFGPNEEGILRKLAGDKWQASYSDYMAMYAADHDRYPGLFPGFAELLEDPRLGHLPSAIVTGKGQEAVEYSLNHWGLGHYFDVLEAGSATGSVKPEAIQRIVTHWGYDPSTVAYIGDSPNDIRDAKLAGVVPIGASWAETADHAELVAAQPEAVFASVDEFAEWLLAVATPIDMGVLRGN